MTLKQKGIAAAKSVQIGAKRSLRDAFKEFVDDPTEENKAKVARLMDEYQSADVRYSLAHTMIEVDL